MQKTKTLVFGAAFVAVVAAAVWYALRPQEPPAPPAPPPQAAAQKPADVALPPPADSDAQVRKELSGASSRPEWAKWLSESDLLERWVTIADNLSEGTSPRKQLGFAGPDRKFMVQERKGRFTIDPRSYQRYDTFADVIGSVDPKVVAVAFHALHPLLESAYHRLGYPDRKLDDVAQKALQRLIDAPVAEGSVELEPKGALYKFADGKLESKGAVEKHLLRMGPRNTKIIQGKARDLAAALDLRIAAH